MARPRLRAHAGATAAVALASLTVLVINAAFAIWRGPWPRRTARPCFRGLEHEDEASGNVGGALGLEDLQWQQHQAQVDAGELTGAGQRARAAELLVEGALGRLRPHVQPAARWDEPLPYMVYGGGLPDGLLAALRALLCEDGRYVTDFLAEEAQMSAVHEAFMSAEMYLARLQAQPSEKPPQEALEEVHERAKAVATTFVPELDGGLESDSELESSVLVARHNFASTACFGYFLRRCRQRLALERSFGAGTTLEGFVRGASPQDTVELVRPSTVEAKAALNLRADTLFGNLRELQGQFERESEGLQQLDLSVAQAQRLTVEAAVFGAALFEAEEVAARRARLQYTAFGSRHGDEV